MLLTRVRGITCNLLQLCEMHAINSTSSGNAYAPNRRNSLTYTVRTSRQRSCNQGVGCLLCSIARIYDLWDGSLNKRNLRTRSLVACCGQDGYRDQVLQHPINTYRYISQKKCCEKKSFMVFIFFLHIIYTLKQRKF